MKRRSFLASLLSLLGIGKSLVDAAVENGITITIYDWDPKTKQYMPRELPKPFPMQPHT